MGKIKTLWVHTEWDWPDQSNRGVERSTYHKKFNEFEISPQATVTYTRDIYNTRGLWPPSKSAIWKTGISQSMWFYNLIVDFKKILLYGYNEHREKLARVLKNGMLFQLFLNVSINSQPYYTYAS